MRLRDLEIKAQSFQCLAHFAVVQCVIAILGMQVSVPQRVLGDEQDGQPRFGGLRNGKRTELCDKFLGVRGMEIALPA